MTVARGQERLLAPVGLLSLWLRRAVRGESRDKPIGRSGGRAKGPGSCGEIRRAREPSRVGMALRIDGNAMGARWGLITRSR